MSCSLVTNRGVQSALFAFFQQSADHQVQATCTDVGSSIASLGSYFVYFLT